MPILAELESILWGILKAVERGEEQNFDPESLTQEVQRWFVWFLFVACAEDRGVIEAQKAHPELLLRNIACKPHRAAENVHELFQALGRSDNPHTVSLG